MHSCAVVAFVFDETNCTFRTEKRGMPTLLRGGGRSVFLCIHHKKYSPEEFV